MYKPFENYGASATSTLICTVLVVLSGCEADKDEQLRPVVSHNQVDAERQASAHEEPDFVDHRVRTALILMVHYAEMLDSAVSPDDASARQSAEGNVTVARLMIHEILLCDSVIALFPPAQRQAAKKFLQLLADVGMNAQETLTSDAPPSVLVASLARGTAALDKLCDNNGESYYQLRHVSDRERKDAGSILLTICGADN